MPVSKLRKNRPNRNKPNTKLPTKMSTEISREGRRVQGQDPKVQHSQSFYQGIVPSPEMMEKYKDVDPNLPMVLVKLTQDEAEHRRSIEKSLVKNNATSNIIGQILAFLSVIAICTLSYLYMINGNADQGKAIAITIIIGIASAFLGRKIFYRNEKSK
jgi:uncharacterized membrane protein